MDTPGGKLFDREYREQHAKGVFEARERLIELGIIEEIPGDLQARIPGNMFRVRPTIALTARACWITGSMQRFYHLHMYLAEKYGLVATHMMAEDSLPTANLPGLTKVETIARRYDLLSKEFGHIARYLWNTATKYRADMGIKRR